MIPGELLASLEQAVGPALSRGELPELPVLGCGEISVVLGLEHEGQRLACKRMPAFTDEPAVLRYRQLCQRYLEELRAAGLTVPDCQLGWQPGATGGLVVYYLQERLPREAFVHHQLHQLDAGEGTRLLGRVMGCLAGVAEANQRRADLQIGIDGQVSNWALLPGAGEQPLCYIDTSTPLLRQGGRELLDVELLLQSLPAPLLPLVRLLFLREILDRYYDVRRVLRDLLGNLLKERLEPLLEPALAEANALLRGRLSWLQAAPIEEGEVRRYYRADARMWEILLRLRRLDRFVKRRLLGRPYPFLLPDRIER